MRRRSTRRHRRLAVEHLESRQLLSTIRLDSPQAPVGDVDDYAMSPDGRFAVYSADANSDQMLELFSVNFSTGQVTRLNDPLVVGGGVIEFQISPNSGRVVYRAVQDSIGVPELYSVAITGGGTTKLNSPLVDGGSVVGLPDPPVFQVSPDGRRVVYLADQEHDDVFELYSVPITGGAATKLNGPLASGGDVFAGFQISPDSTRVAYRADQMNDRVIELYTVPIDGGGPTRVSEELVAGDYTGFQFTPDGSHIVYRDVDLYRVPAAGGAITKLNDPLLDGQFVDSFAISPDGGRVVYLAKGATIRPEFFTGELYSVPSLAATRSISTAPSSVFLVCRSTKSAATASMWFTGPIMRSAPSTSSTVSRLTAGSHKS